MYCVEALGCLSVYIDTEVYVYMQVYSASAAGSEKIKGHELPTVNYQLSSVNCQVMNYPLSTVNCPVLTVNYQVLTVNLG